MAVRWQARQVRDEASDQFRHLRNADSLNDYAHNADPQGLSRRQSTGSPIHARRRSTETSRAAEKMRFQVSKARRQRIEEAKEAARVGRERMKPRSKLLPAAQASPLDKKKLPPIKKKKKQKSGGSDNRGDEEDEEGEGELTGAQWAARERLRQQEHAEQPQAEIEEQRRKEAKARSAGRFKPSVMKEREELQNPVKLPKAWIEADKRRARKIERAKLPLCKRWFPCCICCHGRSKVEPEDGNGKRRRRQKNDS